jgi:DNA/RNA endonuclease YhcR with UshA esterase domain
MANWHCS